MASASRLSFLLDLTYGFTNCGAMSFTSWPYARKRLAQSCAPPQASMPMRTGGSFAIKGVRSCRDKRLRNTIFPVLSIPMACNTRVAMSIPSTLISCFIGLASCGSMGSRIVNSLWLIEVDPHRGGSISLRPNSERPLGASVGDETRTELPQVWPNVTDEAGHGTAHIPFIALSVGLKPLAVVVATQCFKEGKQGCVKVGLCGHE